MNVYSPQVNVLVTFYEPAKDSEVRKLIRSSQNNSCDLDPTTLLHACLDFTWYNNTYQNVSQGPGKYPDDFTQ